MTIKKLLTFTLIFSSFITLKSMEREYEGDKKLEQDEETKLETLALTSKKQLRTSKRLSRPINFKDLKTSGINVKQEIENQYNEDEWLSKQRLEYRHEISEIINTLFNCISKNNDEEFKEIFAQYSNNPDIVNARNKGGLTLAIIAAENLLNKNKAFKGINKLRAKITKLFKKESPETAFEKARHILYEILCPSEDGVSARNEYLKLRQKTDRGSLESYLRTMKANRLANQIHEEKETDKDKLDQLKEDLNTLKKELIDIENLLKSNDKEEIKNIVYKIKYSKKIEDLKFRWESDNIEKKQYYVSQRQDYIRSRIIKLIGYLLKKTNPVLPLEIVERIKELDTRVVKVQNMTFEELNKFIGNDLKEAKENFENMSLDKMKKDIEEYYQSKLAEIQKKSEKINILQEKMKS